MKRRGWQIALVAALIVLAVVLQRRNRLPDSPERAVTAFFDAAEAGDDSAYLRLTDGELKNRLEATRREQGADAFRRALKQTAQGLKALNMIRAPESSEERVVLDVDLVYEDRSERQRFTLEKRSGGWIITALESAEYYQPEIPYGTPVFEVPLPQRNGADAAEGADGRTSAGK
ncbi:hypothetical protein JCM19992_33950 [Thermostilla marina]